MYDVNSLVIAVKTCYYLRIESKIALAMLKDHETKEPARKVAERKWHNHDLEKRFKEKINEAKQSAAPIKTEPDIAEVVTTERRRADVVTKFQNKFVKDFKTMVAEHKRRTVLLYRLSLRSQIHRLKLEKLRRLEAKEAQQAAKEAQRAAQRKNGDLFA
jgi:hypothetical protein